MGLTFVVLTLGLTLQILFSSDGTGQGVDPARDRGVLEAEPRDEPTSRPPSFPLSAVIGAQWPGSAPPPEPTPAVPLTE